MTYFGYCCQGLLDERGLKQLYNWPWCSFIYLRIIYKARWWAFHWGVWGEKRSPSWRRLRISKAPQLNLPEEDRMGKPTRAASWIIAKDPFPQSLSLNSPPSSFSEPRDPLWYRGTHTFLQDTTQSSTIVHKISFSYHLCHLTTKLWLLLEYLTCWYWYQCWDFDRYSMHSIK